jgi:hypothetical protein
MAFPARVHLKRRPPRKDVTFLGEIDLELRPVLHGRTVFVHEGQKVMGYIEMLMPSDWVARDVVPTIRVVQG